MAGDPESVAKEEDEEEEEDSVVLLSQDPTLPLPDHRLKDPYWDLTENVVRQLYNQRMEQNEEISREDKETLRQSIQSIWERHGLKMFEDFDKRRVQDRLNNIITKLNRESTPRAPGPPPHPKNLFVKEIRAEAVRLRNGCAGGIVTKAARKSLSKFIEKLWSDNGIEYTMSQLRRRNRSAFLNEEEREAIRLRACNYRKEVSAEQAEVLAAAMESEFAKQPPPGIPLRPPDGVDNATEWLKQAKNNLAKLHITDTHPNNFRQFHKKNKPHKRRLHKHTVVPPSWLAAEQHRNALRFIKKRGGGKRSPIDGSWWGLSLEGAFAFAEWNQKRGWVSARIPLYVHVIYPKRKGEAKVNPMHTGIKPMGALQDWYMHSLNPVLADEIYEFLPMADGTYTMTLIWSHS